MRHERATGGQADRQVRGRGRRGSRPGTRKALIAKAQTLRRRSCRRSVLLHMHLPYLGKAGLCLFSSQENSWQVGARTPNTVSVWFSPYSVLTVAITLSSRSCVPEWSDSIERQMLRDHLGLSLSGPPGKKRHPSTRSSAVSSVFRAYLQVHMCHQKQHGQHWGKVDERGGLAFGGKTT